MPDNLTALARFLERPPATSLLVAADAPDNADTPVIQRVNLTDEVAADFLETARAAVPAAGNVTLREYDPGYKPETDDLTYIPLDELGSVQDLVQDAEQVGQAALFTADDNLIKRLRFYAIVVSGPGGRRAVFFRHYSPKKELGRHAAFALMLRRGQYDRVREKVFLFDDDVDCFSWNGRLYIKHVVQFQRIFRYFEALRDKAHSTIRKVNRRVPISNLNDFEQACSSDTRMLAKLASIARKPYLTRVTFADVERTITEFHLDVEVVSDGDGKKLVFDTARERRWLILKLLDDDYLGSTMSRERYEVNSKTRLR